MNKTEYENLKNGPLVIDGFTKYLIMNAVFILFCVVLPISVGAVGAMSAIMSAALFIQGEITFMEAFSAGTVILFICTIFITLSWRNPMAKIRFVFKSDENI